MANSNAIQILQDGPLNHVVKLTGTLDTSDLASTTVVDVSALSSITTDGANAPTRVRVERIEYDLSDGLICNLLWDATTDVLLAVRETG